MLLSLSLLAGLLHPFIEFLQLLGFISIMIRGSVCLLDYHWITFPFQSGSLFEVLQILGLNMMLEH